MGRGKGRGEGKGKGKGKEEGKGRGREGKGRLRGGRVILNCPFISPIHVLGVLVDLAVDSAMRT